MARVIVITEASAGVGRATALAFAVPHFDVGLIARGPSRLEATAAEVGDRGRWATAVSADVTDAAAIDTTVRLIEAELGPISHLGQQRHVHRFRPRAGRDRQIGVATHASDLSRTGPRHDCRLALHAVTPGQTDRYLSACGYDGQMTSVPTAPDAPANLFEPAAGDGVAAHGPFGAQARSLGWEMIVERHPGRFPSAACAGLIGPHLLAQRLTL